MINEVHLEELRSRFYYVSQQFGGAPDLLTQLSLAPSRPNLSIEEKVHYILSHPTTIGVVTPWEPVVSLIDETNPNQSILPNFPYQIHDLDGRLIYKVLNHNGLYGGSVMDKALILQSSSGSLYYLHYMSYVGPRTMLLIVNNLALEYSNPLSDRDYLKAPPPSTAIREPANNYITIDASPILTNESVIKIYHMKTEVLKVPKISELTSSPYTTAEEYFLSPLDPLLIYIPSASGWLYFTQGDSPLVLVDLTGAGDDRLIPASSNLYYIAVGDEMDTNLIRQALGLVSRRPPGFSTANVIRLSAKLDTP